MVSNTGLRSVGELLMMPRTSEVAVSRSNDALSSREVAVCCATASSSLRVSSAIFFWSLVRGAGVVALRGGGLTALRRLVFRPLIRFIATWSPKLQQAVAGRPTSMVCHRVDGGPVLSEHPAQ